MQAIVAAFTLDERTIAHWQWRVHAQCERVHSHLMQAGRGTSGQARADELHVRMVDELDWPAMALTVTGRLSLGGVVSATHVRALIRALLTWACGALAAVQFCTDGLSSYWCQALRLFRQHVRSGDRGRPRLILPPDVLIAQAGKRYARQTTASVNMTYIERLNVTLRTCLSLPVRRSRAIVQRLATLETGM